MLRKSVARVRALRKETEQGKGGLLDALAGEVVADQVIEDGQDVTPVTDHFFQHRPEPRLVLRFAVPFGQNDGRHFDILAQLIRRVAAQKEAIEKGRFPLRELKILQRIFRGTG